MMLLKNLESIINSLKTSYPNAEFSKEEIKEILTFALEMRRRVKEQLKKIGGMEFYDVNFSNINNKTFEEHYVTVPEQGGGKIIPEGLTNPGNVYTISRGKSGISLRGSDRTLSATRYVPWSIIVTRRVIKADRSGLPRANNIRTCEVRFRACVSLACNAERIQFSSFARRKIKPLTIQGNLRGQCVKKIKKYLKKVEKFFDRN